MSREFRKCEDFEGIDFYITDFEGYIIIDEQDFKKLPKEVQRLAKEVQTVDTCDVFGWKSYAAKNEAGEYGISLENDSPFLEEIAEDNGVGPEELLREAENSARKLIDAFPDKEIIFSVEDGGAGGIRVYMFFTDITSQEQLMEIAERAHHYYSGALPKLAKNILDRIEDEEELGDDDFGVRDIDE